MDQDTLANHLSRCGQREFEIACKLILQEVLNLNVINVDGANDGGTDFISLDSGGGEIKLLIKLRLRKQILRIKHIEMRRRALLN